MVLINFYKEYETSWDELQKIALNRINELIKNTPKNPKELGDLPPKFQFEEYKKVIEMGMKTFIFEIINSWEFLEIIIVGDKFYKKYEFMEIDGYMKKLKMPNLFKNYIELFDEFKKNSLKISPSEFDEIKDNFTSDVVVSINSFEYELKDIREDGEWLDDNGFGDLFD